MNVAAVRTRISALYRGDVARSAGVLMLSNMILSGFGFIFWFVAAHLEKKSAIGIASVLLTAVSLLSTTGLLGLDSGVLRFLPDGEGAKRQMQTVLFFTTMASAVLGVGYVAVAGHLSHHLRFLTHDWFTDGLILLVYLEAMVFSTIAQNVFISRKRTWTVLVANTSFSVLKVALIPVLVGVGAMGLISASATALVVSVTILVTVMRKRLRLTMLPRWHRGALTHVRRYATTLFFTGVENNIVQALIPLLVLNRLGSEQAGAYYIALNVSMIMSFVASSTFQSLVATAQSATEPLERRVHDALVHVSLLLVPMVIGVIVLAPFVLSLFGHVYATQATTLLRLLALAAPFSAMNYLFDGVTHIHTRNRLFFATNSFNCVAVLMFAFVFVSHGLTGLGMAWLFGQAATVAVYLVIFRNDVLKWLVPRKGVHHDHA